MKIQDAKTFIVGNPPPSRGGPYFVFVKLITDNNIAGYGEVYGVPFHPSKVAMLVEDVVARHVIDWDPFNIERLWRIIYSGWVHPASRPDNVRDIERYRDGMLGHCGKSAGTARLQLTWGESP